MSHTKNDEEFNNFMHRATEVNAIVKQLCSSDRNEYGNLNLLILDFLSYID